VVIPERAPNGALYNRPRAQETIGGVEGSEFEASRRAITAKKS
jgi:hypothetical protein